MTDLDDDLVAEANATPLSKRELRELERLETFLDKLLEGEGPISAGVIAGWTPAQTRVRMRDPEIAEMITDIEEQKDEAVETKAYRLARAGNTRMIMLWLFNRQRSKWRDVRHITVERRDQLEVGVILSVREGIKQQLGESGVAALQPGGPMDAIEAEARDVPADD